MSTSMVRAGTTAAAVVNEGFGSQETQAVVETASQAIQARETALIQSRFVMAERHPRNIDRVRVKLLDACKRPMFAGVARYSKPVGKEKNKVTGKWEEKIAHGPSIRFIEEAVRQMGNIDIFPSVIYDDPQRRVFRITALDLETNFSWSEEITIEKVVERRFAKDDDVVLGERTNSKGEKVYTIVASKDDVQKEQQRLYSLRARKLGERLVDAGIVEECMAQVLATEANEVKENPDAVKLKIIDSFHSIGVEPNDLVQYLGHSLERLTPAEIQQLRGMYTCIRDGELSWEEAMLARDPAGSAEAAEDVAKKKIAEMEAKAASRKATAAAKREAKPEAAPAPTPQVVEPEPEPKDPEVVDAENNHGQDEEPQTSGFAQEEPERRTATVTDPEEWQRKQREEIQARMEAKRAENAKKEAAPQPRLKL